MYTHDGGLITHRRTALAEAYPATAYTCAMDTAVGDADMEASDGAFGSKMDASQATEGCRELPAAAKPPRRLFQKKIHTRRIGVLGHVRCAGIEPPVLKMKAGDGDPPHTLLESPRRPWLF